MYLTRPDYQMFMEAVILSLKDLEMRHPNPHADEQTPGNTPDSSKLSEKDNYHDAVSPVEQREPVETASTSTSSGQRGSLKTESISSSAIKANDSRPEQQTPDTSVPSIKPASQTSTSTRDLGSAGPSTQSDAPAKIQSTSDTDMSANTTATVTVVKNPASHVMDGLMRRWDFNFFRNNHSR